jgi:hypothetical protein
VMEDDGEMVKRVMVCCVTADSRRRFLGVRSAR